MRQCRDCLPTPCRTSTGGHFGCRGIEAVAGLHSRRSVQHGGACEDRDLRLHRRRSRDGSAAQADARRGWQAARLRWRLDFVLHRIGDQNGEGHRQADGGLWLASEPEQKTAARSGLSSRLASRWTRRSTNRCSSSRRHGAGRACIPIFARRAPGRMCSTRGSSRTLQKQGKDIEAIKAAKDEGDRPLLPADDRACAACAGRHQTRLPGL